MMNKMLAAALIFFGLPIVASAAPSDTFAQLLLVLQSLQPEKTLGDGDTATFGSNNQFECQPIGCYLW
jgi:hypothetical protein